MSSFTDQTAGLQEVNRQAGGFAPGTAIMVVSHGFMANYERGFTNGLAASGVDVTLISSDNTDYPGLIPAVKTRNLRGSQDSGRSRIQKMLNLVKYQLALVAAVIGAFPKNPAKRPIVHVIGLIQPPILFGVFDGLIFKLFAKRYVLTVHDILPRDGCSDFSKKLFGLSYKIADHLVVHTETMRAEIVKLFGIDPSRITIMEHGLEPAAVSLRPYNSAKPLQFLCFGHVKHYKGVDVLLAALETYDQPFVLRIVGSCLDPELTATMRGLIAKHPHASQISWQNEHVEESVMEQLFVDSDVLVMPYRHIDQSGVLFQALRFGLPVVATRVGALAQYVTHEIGEIAPPNDPLALRDALLRLAQRYRDVGRGRIVEASRRWEWKLTIAAAVPQAYAG